MAAGVPTLIVTGLRGQAEDAIVAVVTAGGITKAFPDMSIVLTLDKISVIVRIVSDFAHLGDCAASICK